MLSLYQCDAGNEVGHPMSHHLHGPWQLPTGPVSLGSIPDNPAGLPDTFVKIFLMEDNMGFLKRKSPPVAFLGGSYTLISGQILIVSRRLEFLCGGGVGCHGWY